MKGKELEREIGVTANILIGTMVVCFIAFVFLFNMVFTLQEEIDSMPHYNCWDETTVEKWTIEEIAMECYNPHQEGIEIACSPRLNFPYKYTCSNNVCYVEVAREVCELDKEVTQGERVK